MNSEMFKDHPDLEVIARKEMRLKTLKQEIKKETDLKEKLFKYDIPI